jgi:hypothetical protein
MKVTIDIPDDLYRKVKANSALQGRPIRAVALELFGAWVDESTHSDAGQRIVSVGELMADSCGMFDSGVTDLSTNPAYLEELGRDSPGDR